MIVLLYIILGWFVLGWLLKVLSPYLMQWALRRSQQRMQQQMNDIFGQRGATGPNGRRDTGRNAPKPEPKSKKIDPTVGEYINFEEVTVTKTVTDAPKAGIDYKVEEQITDAEWEDIK